jgi:hypothetical protein
MVLAGTLRLIGKARWPAISSSTAGTAQPASYRARQAIPTGTGPGPGEPA